MFLEKDERLLIMELVNAIAGGTSYMNQTNLSISDFQKLEEAGIKTIYLECFSHLNLDWQIMFDKLDDILENTNLKLICPFWYASPPGENWLLHKEINYADPNVGKSIDEVTLKFLDQLGNRRDRVQVTYAYNQGGEFLWAVDKNWGTHNALDEMVAEFIVERQRILSSQHNEVWSAMHDAMGGAWETSLVVNNALYAEFPDCQHYRIQHAYFAWNTRPDGGSPDRIPWAKYFIGSDYVAGLTTNYDLGIKHGTWGFLTAPLHHEGTESVLQDRMIDGIKVALKKLSLEPDHLGAWERRFE